MPERQEILHLWLGAAALDTDVKAWAHHSVENDGADGDDGDTATRHFDGPEPPYRTGLDALRDGWLLIQSPGSIDVASINGELPAEFVFERRHPVN